MRERRWETTSPLTFHQVLAVGERLAALGLLAAWEIIVWLQRGQWTAAALAVEVAAEPYRAWPVWKGVGVLSLLLAFPPLGRARCLHEEPHVRLLCQRALN